MGRIIEFVTNPRVIAFLVIVILLVGILITLNVNRNILLDIRDPERRSDVEDSGLIFGGNFPLDGKGTVVEIISDRTLIVEMIEDNFFDNETPDQRGNTSLFVGDMVKVIYSARYDWAADVINTKLEVGSVIEFIYWSTEIIDFSQEPFVVQGIGIRVFAEDGETVVFESHI